MLFEGKGKKKFLTMENLHVTFIITIMSARETSSLTAQQPTSMARC